MDKTGEGIDWDKLFYIYCIEIGQPEEYFYKGAFKKITMVVDEYTKSLSLKSRAARSGYENSHEVKSMKQLRGMIKGV